MNRLDAALLDFNYGDSHSSDVLGFDVCICCSTFHTMMSKSSLMTTSPECTVAFRMNEVKADVVSSDKQLF